ncbi:MAG: DUF2721 domain-containing protein [Anaerolineae bacterium]|nr:DUF2721 domain-containing protein [Anaerolineae bacterium]
MDVENLARTIQIVLAPVVMISACAITVGGLWGHASSINDRLRAMNRERLELWRSASDDVYTTERLLQIDTQTPSLVCRHRRVIQAIVTIYAAILVYIVSMFLIAAASMMNISATLALLLFLAGTLLLLIAIVLAILEIRISQTAIEFEVQRAGRLRPE